MRGMQHIKSPLTGKLLIKCIAQIFVLGFLLTGCSAEWWAGYGRGDWSIPIHNGYEITKVNSSEILLTYKENPDDTSCSIVIPYFYITAYQIQEQYILLEGIPTQNSMASDEELATELRSYYLINTTTGEITRPLSSQSLNDECEKLCLEPDEEWIIIKLDTGLS